ncbi:hypothetical protein B0A50_00357 [Salinomyces thailandicus]|uniref:Enoyl reductase (ER) domain-containing protein n=1 Tax=Salinomyces thailandicus TaxID=706561 RepID=A0A4U0UF69_9PEZI|nr:hypothetical protein B0A50_00357 [Salinomyces thailandica]
MRAVQFITPGSAATALKIVDLPTPKPKATQILLKIKAFGLNRSELLSRLYGRAPIGPVPSGRVLGVEATGVVEETGAEVSVSSYPKGAIAMTAIGGMGIAYDGGYAQYCCVEASNVRVLKSQNTQLSWEVLGALPEMLQTAWGCLFRCLKLKAGDKLLVRGGTTSVGLAAAAIAKRHGAAVMSTTRRADSTTHNLLKDNGAEHILVDDDKDLRPAVTAVWPTGADKVLELVGGSSLASSLACLAPEGICCFVGLVGGSPAITDFSPLAMIPTGAYLTAYAERTFQASNFPLDELVQDIEDGSLPVKPGKVFQLNEIVEAHECLEKGESGGKIVVLTGM